MHAVTVLRPRTKTSQGLGRHGPILDTPLQDFNAQAYFCQPLSRNPAFGWKSKSKTYIFKSLIKKKTLYFFIKNIGFTFTFLPGAAYARRFLEGDPRSQPQDVKSATKYP